MIKCNRGLMATAVAATLLATTAAQAVPSVGLTLGAPMYNGSQAEMDVNVFFDDADIPGSALAFFQLDASMSDGSLTAGGTNYSRFSFAPSAAVADWDLFFDFGPTAIDSVVAYDSFPNGDPLLAGMHTLGTLSVDLSGLAAGSVHQVDLGFFDPFGTFFFYEEVPGDPGTSGEAEINLQLTSPVATITVPTSTTPAVPEPATAALAMIGLAGLAARRRRA